MKDFGGNDNSAAVVLNAVARATKSSTAAFAGVRDDMMVHPPFFTRHVFCVFHKIHASYGTTRFFSSKISATDRPGVFFVCIEIA